MPAPVQLTLSDELLHHLRSEIDKPGIRVWVTVRVEAIEAMLVDLSRLAAAVPHDVGIERKGQRR